METITSSSEAVQCVALGYEFEEIFADVRRTVALLNRQRELPGAEQRLAVVWEDDVERRLLQGSWTRINNELQRRLAGWIAEAHVDDARADFKLKLQGANCPPCFRDGLELQFKRAVRAAFLFDILGAADLAALVCTCREEHIHEIAGSLALCGQ